MKVGIALFAWNDSGGVNKIHKTIIGNTELKWDIFYIEKHGFFLAFMKLLHKFWNTNYDVIFVGNGREALIVEIIKFFYRLKTEIIYVQHTPIDKKNKVSIHQKCIFKLLSKRQKLITISQELKNRLVTTIGLESSALRVIYNPVLKSNTTKINLYPIKSTIKLIGIGRLSHQKNFSFMIGLVAYMRERGHDVILDIFGVGEDQRSLQILIEEMNLCSFVCLKGLSNSVPEKLNAADVFLLSSFWEGLPTVLIEALENCKRIVAYSCPTGVKEILHGQYATAIVAELDYAKFEEKILQMASIEGSGSRDLSPFNLEKNIMAYKEVFNV